MKFYIISKVKFFQIIFIYIYILAIIFVLCYKEISLNSSKILNLINIYVYIKYNATIFISIEI